MEASPYRKGGEDDQPRDDKHDEDAEETLEIILVHIFYFCERKTIYVYTISLAFIVARKMEGLNILSRVG